MSKRDGGPCSNCGGTVYYDKGSCVACTSERASKRQKEQLKELRQLREYNAYMLSTIEMAYSALGLPAGRGILEASSLLESAITRIRDRK